MLKAGYDGNYTLLYQDGHPAELGDMIMDNNGRKHKITWATPPHKPGSTGKVTVDGNREYYVSVFDMRWKRA